MHDFIICFIYNPYTFCDTILYVVYFWHWFIDPNQCVFAP